MIYLCQNKVASRARLNALMAFFCPRRPVAIFIFIALSVGLASGCSSTNGGVPVFNAGENIFFGSRSHTVRPGETLYSIAFRYGLDFNEIARANNIKSPYLIFVNQKITLPRASSSKSNSTDKPQSKSKKTKKTKKAKSSASKSQQKTQTNDSKIQWRWPISGEMVGGFSLSGKVNKGVDLRGKLGESVLSAGDGVVVYAGGGLRGYSKLVIVKHSDRYLSAYGNNGAIYVKEGDKVTAGEKIAVIGSSGSKIEILHFEIRRNGKPENPLIYLPKR
jgi:lipoprotein NlpD